MPVYDYECQDKKCKAQFVMLLSVKEHTSERACVKCGGRAKTIVHPPAHLGRAKSRNLWDRSDTESDNAADRDIWESYKSLEKDGKLTPKMKHDHKEEIGELLSRRSEFE